MKKWGFIAIAFIAIFLGLSAWSIRTTSVTVDETFYLSCGLQSVRDRHLDPRLIQYGVAPLPILLNYLLPFSLAEPHDRPTPWIGEKEDPGLIPGPRFSNVILVGVPLMLTVSLWLYRRHGLAAAAAGAGLAALSPTILAHSSVATTDACFALFVMLSLVVIAAWLKQPSPKRFILMALAIAAAMSAKYTGLFLLPVVFSIYITLRYGDRSKWQVFKKASLTLALLVLLILPLWWGFHLFSFTIPFEKVSEAPLGHGWVADVLRHLGKEEVKLPAPIIGTAFQYLHNRQGQAAFLMGERSQTGWWYFCLLAFLIKSTPVELALTGFLIFCLVTAFRSTVSSFQSLDLELKVLLVALLLLILLMLILRISIAHRYLLPIYPLLFILGIDRLWIRVKKKELSTTVVAAAIVIGQAWSCLSIAPHFLSYFNGLVGGPEHAWQLMVDSNIDWGQDLPALRKELEKRQASHVAFAYFGTAAPAAYGVQADPILALPLPAKDYKLLAVSVSLLQGLLSLPGDNPFREFLSMEPVARAGYSIFLFDLSEPQAVAAFEGAVEHMRGQRVHNANAGTDGTLSLYQFTMTLLSAQDYENLDIFDLCYAELFRNASATPAQLSQVEQKLQVEPEGSDYRTHFRQAILHLARLILLPRASMVQHGEGWTQAFDYNLFREDYKRSLELLRGSAQVGVPLIEVVEKTGERIDENGDGSFSDTEIARFLSNK